VSLLFLFQAFDGCRMLAQRLLTKLGVTDMLKILLTALTLTAIAGTVVQAQTRNCTTTCDPPGRGWNSCRTVCW